MRCYTGYFGLMELPFTAADNLDVYYGNYEQQATLASILFSLKDDSRIIKIIGAAGIGKTVLANRAIFALSLDYSCCYCASSQLTVKELLTKLAKDLFSIQSELPYSELEQTLLKKMSAYNKKVVIALDDAQSLPDNTIAWLLERKNPIINSLQVILLGTSLIDERINLIKASMPISTFISTISLLSANKYELKEYIRLRLMATGHPSGDLFSSSARKLLFKISYGVPGVVNILCNRALFLAYKHRLSRVNFDIIKQVVADSGKLLVVKNNFAAMAWWNDICTFTILASGVACVMVYHAYKVTM